MIKFDSNEQILNYLMTTDFAGENLSPEEMIELLNKFRYYYRKTHSQIKGKEHEIAKLNKKINSYKNSIEVLEREIEVGDVKIERLKNKKLSWRERIKGKIT